MIEGALGSLPPHVRSTLGVLGIKPGDLVGGRSDANAKKQKKSQRSKTAERKKPEKTAPPAEEKNPLDDVIELKCGRDGVWTQ